MPFDEHLVKAEEQGSTVTSEMEVFFSLCPCRIFAVTGSDGKTTTTTLISEILKSAGYRVHLGGNIGTPLLCKLPEMQADDLVVLELSSFQLHSMFCRPNIAVITNLSPNHLDKHDGFQDYIDAKAWIFQNQQPGDRLILNANDSHTAYYASKAHSTISFFSDAAPVENGCICEDGIIYLVSGTSRIPVMHADEIRIPGQHNVQNMLAAFEAVRDYASPEICRQVARTFPGVPHRLEEVRVLHGVTYINDSIASSPTRTIAGLRAKAVILTGDTSDKIACSIQDAVKHRGQENLLPVYQVSDLQEAVHTAGSIAEDGDIVILSPACASFDRFRNFEERGNLFRQYVMELES